MKDSVKKVIIAYEMGERPLEQTRHDLYQLTGKTIDAYALNTYDASESLENFVRRLCTQPISEWAQIDDQEAITLIEEMRANPCDDATLERNEEALCRRFGKPEGSILERIFEGDQTVITILDWLKTDTRIHLN